MTRFRKRLLYRAESAAVLSAVLFVAVLAAAGAYLGADEVLARIKRVGPPVLAVLLALSLVNYALRGLRWHLYERRLGLRVPIACSALFYVAGFAMTTTPGKLGEALRLWLLERRYGYAYARTVPLLIGDRLGDVSAIVLLCLIGLGSFAGYAWFTALALGATGLTSLLLLKPGLLMRAVSLAFAAIGRSPRLFAGLRIGLRHTRRLFAPSTYAAALALGLVGWLAESLALFWLLRELGADIGLSEAVFVFAFSMLAGGLSMLPGGLGGAEATMFALLAALGVEAETALAATALIRATTLWFAVALGFLALPAALGLARTRERARLGIEPSA